MNLIKHPLIPSACLKCQSYITAKGNR